MMDATTPAAPWLSRYAREIIAILLLKLLILCVIKLIWFDTPTTPVDGTARTSAHLLDSSPPTPAPNSPLAKEP